MFPKDGIKISAVLLHSHNAGFGVRLRHFRGQKELPWILWDDNYDNYVQPTRALREEVRVLPGDQLTMECHYKTNETTLQSSFATSQEICNAILLVTPRIEDYGTCVSGMNAPEARERFLGIRNASWVQDEWLEWRAESPEQLRGLRVTEISDRLVDWTEEKRRELQRFHERNPQVNHCFKDVALLTLEEYRKLPVGPLGVLDPTPMDTERGLTEPVEYPFGAKAYVPPEDESCQLPLD